MAPATGEPRESPKPQPLGHFPSVLFFTTATICLLFVLWRRANALRTVVSHQLKTWSRREGNIRLSIDDGPPAHSFLEDEYDVDNDGLDDEPLALRAEELRLARQALAPEPEPEQPAPKPPTEEPQAKSPPAE
ncbi:hypothetical protein EVG20_g5647 [Dentipellis fragilis]|uniref:Uncharacterized protein n=1 Tax=Dentipellis fragilis TaxID=205917 RepID=A0A4Y9YU88_9AGAM|nr:hypothetical protein EVG20_g5647 [Dentipellis fragilis]